MPFHGEKSHLFIAEVDDFEPKDFIVNILNDVSSASVLADLCLVESLWNGRRYVISKRKLVFLLLLDKLRFCSAMSLGE